MCCVPLAGNTGRKKSPPAHHRTILSGNIFVTKARIDNRKKKLVKQQYVLHMCLQYGELRPTICWDPLVSFGHPSKLQWVSRLGSVTARDSSSGHQSNFVALNRGCHLYSTGRPSRWALAHILVLLLSIYGIGQTNIFSSCRLVFFLSSFFYLLSVFFLA